MCDSLNELFRFNGDSPKNDRIVPHWPQKGEIYMLLITGRGAYMPITIEKPWKIQYEDWNAFFEDWERI